VLDRPHNETEIETKHFQNCFVSIFIHFVVRTVLALPGKWLCLSVASIIWVDEARCFIEE